MHKLKAQTKIEINIMERLIWLVVFDINIRKAMDVRLICKLWQLMDRRGPVPPGIAAAIGDFAWRIYEMKPKYWLLTVL